MRDSRVAGAFSAVVGLLFFFTTGCQPAKGGPNGGEPSGQTVVAEESQLHLGPVAPLPSPLPTAAPAALRIQVTNTSNVPIDVTANDGQTTQDLGTVPRAQTMFFNLTGVPPSLIVSATASGPDPTTGLTPKFSTQTFTSGIDYSLTRPYAAVSFR